ncbi:MAG: DNA helicase UvrD [Porticoccaceae bacterium]|nr:DNA helicase UvrD [Porticoccaceae bacterium]
MTIADQAVREQALDIRHSCAVSAPAGSGKTGLLIRRILRLLAQCDQPEQVLAITFTRKAAAEMQERILDALKLAGADTPPDDDYQRDIWSDARRVLDQDRAKGWHLTASPSRLRIMTIDSLCRNLARQLALETALGDVPEPDEQPELLYRDSIRDFLRHLEEPGPLGEALATLLRHLDNNVGTLETLLEGMLARREQWLTPLLDSQQARQVLEQSLASTVAETLEAVRDALADRASDLALLADYAGGNLTKAHSDSAVRHLTGMTELPGTKATESNLANWQALSDLLLTKRHDWRSPKGISKREGFPTAKDATDPDNAALRKTQLTELIDHCANLPGLLELLIDLRHLPALAYSDGQWHLLEALTQVLPRLAAELSVLFKIRNSCDFTAITLAALDALGSSDAPGDLSLKLDYRIHHILVDEFQDTSAIQFNLLKKLTAGWQADDGRTLFIVGDGMQSLYGFRNANVGIFLEARRLPVGAIPLSPLDLAVNFRSDRQIVDWVNRVFQRVFPDREDIARGAVTYAPAIAARDNLRAPAVTLECFEQECTQSDEARRVIALIRDARDADPEGSIAILTRARSHLREIIPALQAHGIDWQATDMAPLSTRMPVIDLHSLTRALLNPGDRIAWLSILRAPWCGLTLPDLHHLATANDDDAMVQTAFPWLPGQVFSAKIRAGMSQDGRQRLERVGGLLAAAWKNRQRKPLRQAVEGLWLALGGPATLRDSNDMAHCEQYLELLEKHSRGAGLKDMTRFTQAVEKLYAAPLMGLKQPVQIMTIHKAKGLEFDTVILPGLHHGGGRANNSLLYWRERINAAGTPELLIAPPLAPSDTDSDNASRLVSHLKYEDKLKSRLEDARVLYVACTRAIKRLHLLYREPAKAPASGSLLNCLWPILSEGGLNPDAHHRPRPSSENPDTGDSDTLRHLLRLSDHWRHPYLEVGRLPTQAPVSTTTATSTESDGDRTARHTGTVLHRTLSRIVLEGVTAWDANRLERQRRAWDIQLRHLGLDETAAALVVLEQAVSNMLRDDTGRWLLDNRHEESACELALGHGIDAAPELSVIDRTFVDHGVRWIIDYKTAMPHPGQPLGDFLDRETARYREQLDRYSRLFANENREVRTALYFPLVPTLHRL